MSEPTSDLKLLQEVQSRNVIGDWAIRAGLAALIVAFLIRPVDGIFPGAFLVGIAIFAWMRRPSAG